MQISSSNFLNHLSFWYKKSDDECVALASNDFGVDAEQALMNILERDFCTEISDNVVESLYASLNERRQ